ncbi:MAG: CDP-alcohol phosphatidyltransferase family protein [Acidobacteriota bacterium]|nr:MAG: CDP-alcohol phosphatidyltransferase family protein [Acidobacteriota bacterium]
MPLTLPNQLTLLRMGLTPLFLILLLSRQYGWTLLVFMLAAFTDALDGFIARLWRQKTTLGAYLDPVADKMLLAIAILGLALSEFPNRIPVSFAIFFLARDVIILVVILATFFTTERRGLFRPSLLGKATTLFQILLVADALFYNWRGVPSPHLSTLLWIAFSATALSAVQYSLLTSRNLAATQEQNARRMTR